MSDQVETCAKLARLLRQSLAEKHIYTQQMLTEQIARESLFRTAHHCDAEFIKRADEIATLDSLYTYLMVLSFDEVFDSWTMLVRSRLLELILRTLQTTYPNVEHAKRIDDLSETNNLIQLYLRGRSHRQREERLRKLLLHRAVLLDLLHKKITPNNTVDFFFEHFCRMLSANSRQ